MTQAPTAPPPINYTGNAAPPPGDIISNDYVGSYQEWLQHAAMALAQRYMSGDQSMLDSFTGATTSAGQPSRADFGSSANGKTGTISQQTQDFFIRYVTANGGSDPSILSQFGPPPARQATYQPNPDSASAIATGNNATSVQTATISANASIANTTANVNESWNAATLQAATQKYIAEGDWGTQKYVAQLSDQGQTDRLGMQIADNVQARVQQAVAEQNRHQEAEQGLALEVAKYDSQLASQPINWLQYAAWLGKRGQVINGMTLAMASDLVPPQSINPADLASVPGGGVAALQTQMGQQQLAQVAPVTTQNITNQTQLAGQTTPTTSSTPPLASQSLSTNAPAAATPAAAGSQDYATIARNLLGLPADGSQDNAAPTTADLQATYDSTKPLARQPGFTGSAAGSTVTNSLGVNVDPNGQNVDYRQFAKLLPTAQDIQLGAVNSVNKSTPDYLQEMQAARPKGAATGAASYG